MSEVQFGKRSKWPLAAVVSIVLIGGLFGLMKALSSKSAQMSKNELIVYCAAGIKLPVVDAAKAYTEEFGVPIKLEYANSGVLEGRLQQDASFGKHRADLYIPADDTFGSRTKEKGLTYESLPLGAFHLVLAVKPDDDLQISSVKELITNKIPYAICIEKAGAGKKTMKALKKSGDWDSIYKDKKVVFDKVTECAGAIKTSKDIRAGFVWNTTAVQFGLKVIELPELKGAAGTININVTNSSTPSRALHFARYISSEKGGKSFAKHGFTVRSGDPWSESPKLVLFCGGVNKKAIEKTISEFEKREGVKIDASYDGCGTLVTSMSAQNAQGTFPDAFLTCDKSYFDKVSSEFASPEDISSTEIVILVRKGNPHGIKDLKDLTKDGLKAGTTDRRKSTLGYLSWKIFQDAGIEDKMKTNVIVTAPTAHKLITQFMAHDKLDAALVYRANCSQVMDEYDLIAIEHPLATAIQNIGISKKSSYPLILSRLIESLKSARSKNRYEKNGFKWVINK